MKAFSLFSNYIAFSSCFSCFLYCTLNEFEKKPLCNSHFRVEIKRKSGGRFRFTEDMNSHQSQRKIKCHSLLFTRPGPFIKAFRETDCVRKLSKDAELQNPNAINSSKQRKLTTLEHI